MSTKNKIFLLLAFFISSLFVTSCKTKEGCYEDFYEKTNSPEFYNKKRKRKKNTLFTKKQQKRMERKKSGS